MNANEDKADEVMAEFFEALAHATESILAMARTRSFADGVHEYRQVEAKFVERAGHDEFLKLETRRRIIEMILREANIHEQHFQVCQSAWNELLALGFSNTAVAASMARYYADCCLFNEEFDAGLTALEPVMTELRHRIDEPATPRRAYYRDELARLEKLRNQLETGRSD